MVVYFVNGKWDATPTLLRYLKAWHLHRPSPLILTAVVISSQYLLCLILIFFLVLGSLVMVQLIMSIQIDHFFPNYTTYLHLLSYYFMVVHIPLITVNLCICPISWFLHNVFCLTSYGSNF